MDAHRPTIVLKLTAFDPIVHIAETLSPTGHRRWHLECAGCRKAMQQVLEPEKRVHGGLIHARAVPARCLSSIDQTSAIDTVAQPNKQCKQPPYHVHSKLTAPSSQLQTSIRSDSTRANSPRRPLPVVAHPCLVQTARPQWPAGCQ